MGPLFVVFLFTGNNVVVSFLRENVRAETTESRFVAVPFTDVSLTDRFWNPRIETNRTVSIPHNCKWCDDRERFNDFDRAAGTCDGKVNTAYSRDSDVYKLIEGIAYSLAAHPDDDLERYADSIIDRIAAAQMPNGYLNTYYQVNAPDQIWTNIRGMHELYNAGHLIEGAVAYYLATGKKKILDVAERFTDHIIETFGMEPGQKRDVPGHQEIEIALIKLYRLTGKEKYLELCRYFIDARGDIAIRSSLYGSYSQDHEPIRKQREAVGHAVRAMYLYSGATDLAACIGDPDLIAAMNRLWNDVVNTKMYITGGIGARHSGEAFGEAFELPNQSAYCETCAAVGLVFWAHRLNHLHRDARYADVMERALYNGVLSGVAVPGNLFFYVNPLASTGTHHRQPFYSTTCCPTNIARLMPSISGYVYAIDGDDPVVNLYVSGHARIKTASGNVTIRQDANYPWDGQIMLTITSDQNVPPTGERFRVRLRVPEWCAGQFSINGKQVTDIDKGYASVDVARGEETTLNVEMVMEVRRLVAHPGIKTNRGRVALQRGPVVYCFEEADNPGLRDRTTLARTQDFSTSFQTGIADGVVTIQTMATDGKVLQAIPYYAWDHREPGRMVVWVYQQGLPRTPQTDNPGWNHTDGTSILYRPLAESMLSEQDEPFPHHETVTVTAYFFNPGNTLEAVCDGIIPSHSDDHEIPRMTFWDRKGTKEWIELDFEQPITLEQSAVYWFDDERRNGGCRVPESWRLFHREGTEWKPVLTNDDFGCIKDRFNTVHFKKIETSGLRIEVLWKSGFSGGILEWAFE
jgi:DUF1680 family protein